MNQERSLLPLYIQAIRPRTLLASVGPVTLALAYSYKLFHTLNFINAALCLFCAVLLQISSNLINDYFDGIKGTDLERQGPKRVTASGDLSPKQVKVAFIITMSLSFLFGMALIIDGGLTILILGLVCMLFAYLYTGGPFPLSYLALGEILALVFFGPIPVWGTVFLQNQEFQGDALYLGLIPGCLSWSIMAVNNLRDRQTDKKAGKVTLANSNPEMMARFIPMMGIIGCLMVSVFFFKHFTVALILLALLFYPTWLRILAGPIDQGLNACLGQTAKFLFLICLLSAGLFLWMP